MKTLPKSLRAYLSMIDEADRFICFATAWWDDSALDAVVWSERSGRFSKTVLLTGESMEPKPPRINESQIQREEFESLLAEFSAFGVGDIPDQDKVIRLTHFSDWYGLKATASEAPRWTFVAGGKHRDDRVDGWTDWVHRRCPELLTV